MVHNVLHNLTVNIVFLHLLKQTIPHYNDAEYHDDEMVLICEFVSFKLSMKIVNRTKSQTLIFINLFFFCAFHYDMLVRSQGRGDGV